MRLSECISQQIDPLVEEWADFARQNIAPARDLPQEALRDHARMLLEQIVHDMDQPQSGDERHEKSRGNRPGSAPGVTEMARRDAEQRYQQGFSLTEALSEYRALRASVLRRWTESLKVAGFETVEEITRFNEAIDQAISESVRWYVDRVEQSRTLLLGVLGHDLRNPLGAVRNSAAYLSRTGGLTGAQTKAAVRIQASTERMAQMVDDLLDFTRSRLGRGLPIEPAAADLRAVSRQVVDELEAFHPDRVLRMECAGDLAGTWDVRRLAQLVSNVAANAIQHGDPGRPVTVRAHGEGEAVRLQVHNEGPPIAREALPLLFDPLMRPLVQEPERREGSSGLGLGLYIVREIARAHGGQVEVESSAREGTTVTVKLPRHAPAGGSGEGGGA